ncbi:MAG TPA: glycosyltransferase, partial [Acidocella sp.]|nr:glycosyltransferase [Acidocella sp.]
GIPNLPVKPAPALAAQDKPKIIFAKTGNAPAALEQMWRGAPMLEAILHDALDELDFARKGVANVAQFHPLLNKVAAAHKIELQPFSHLSRFLIVQLDDYIRRLKSTAIAKAILPFEVDVFGTAWEHIDKTGARATFHGPVDYARLEAEFPNATASITMNPNIELSAHDRFFTALGAGSMPISDRNQYCETTFPELLPYMFDFTKGSIEAAVEHVVNKPADALELARATRTRTRDAHGVEQAADAILQTVQAARFLGAGPRAEQNFFVP